MTIDNFADDGRGVARVKGKTVFVKGALAGETVSARYIASHQKFDEAIADKIEVASEHRVKPACKYFGRCGGCSLQHLEYDAQVQSKLEKIRRNAAHLQSWPELEIAEPVISAPLHYRHRARFSVSANKAQSLLGFNKEQSKDVVDIDACLLLPASINAKIPVLSELVSQLKQRSSVEELSVVEDSKGRVAVLVSSRRALPESDLLRLLDCAHTEHMHIVACLNSAGVSEPYWSSGGDSDSLVYQLAGMGVELAYSVTDFTQVNTSVNETLVQTAINWLELNANDRLLDLFCGMGNFSIPLAKSGCHVTGVELSQKMIERGNRNAIRNHVSGIEFRQADLISSAPGIAGKFTKALIDPPRAGAEAVCSVMNSWGVQRLVYISCNPGTFFRDARLLEQQGYRLEKLTLADMFPQTMHCELIGLFIYRDAH